MNKKILVALNVLALAGVLVINALAITLPINGMSTGDISELYPSLFTPAGFTFSVWSLLYSLLIGFVVYQWKIMNKVFFVELSCWFLVSCTANLSWILAWHYLLPLASVVIMLVLLFSLTRIFLLLQKQNLVSVGEKIFVKLPFTFYLSWICVATIANISALLVYWEWSGSVLTPTQWTMTLISVATVLGIIVSVRFREPAFLLILIWALFGIYSKWSSTENAPIAITAVAELILLSVVFVTLGIRSIRINDKLHLKT